MVNPFHLLETFQTWGPFIDGVLINEQPITAFQRGNWQKEKPLLLGQSHDPQTYSVLRRKVYAITGTGSSLYVRETN